jgi:hypothetical protein
MVEARWCIPLVREYVISCEAYTCYPSSSLHPACCITHTPGIYPWRPSKQVMCTQACGRRAKNTARAVSLLAVVKREYHHHPYHLYHSSSRGPHVSLQLACIHSTTSLTAALLPPGVCLQLAPRRRPSITGMMEIGKPTSATGRCVNCLLCSCSCSCCSVVQCTVMSSCTPLLLI